MFLNTAYSELIYYLMGLSVGLEVVARSEAGQADGAEPVPRTPEGDLPWWKRPPARRAGPPATLPGWTGGGA
jgi:hypothetical protein